MTTEAGAKLIFYAMGLVADCVSPETSKSISDDLRRMVAAIEAEAREQGIRDVIDRAEKDIRLAERARIAEGVRAQEPIGVLDLDENVVEDCISRAAVLAAIEEKP